MRTRFLNGLIGVLILIGMYGCFLGEKNGEHETESGHMNTATRTAPELLKVGGAALGAFHWGITDDGFGKIAQEWTKSLTINGSVVFGGLKVKTDGIIPTYDKDGHLVKIVISFQPFEIHPESDYAEEEKQELEKRCVVQNKRLISLAEQLSEMYGSPSEDHLAEDYLAIYSEQGTKTLVQWKSSDTQLVLISSNQLYPGKYGCKMQLILEVSQLH
jgi:hypothetical protein